MATYDDKIVYGKDLVPYGQKIVDKMRGEVVDNLNSTGINHPLSANQGKMLNENKLEKGEYDGTAQDLKRDIDSKEPSIVKKSGFNLDKSDDVAYDSGDTLATSRAVKTAYDKGIEALNIANSKLSKTDKAESSKVADKLASPKTISLSGAISGSTTFDGSFNSTINTTLNGIDASKITSGTINIDRLPHGALERLTVVENDAARFKLTKTQVQNGDTVKVVNTKKMYFVKDENQLSSEKGYEEYTVGTATAVDWSGVQNKPSQFPPSAHNQPSSTINSMNGYNKQGYSAISTSDSLNTAIGKLEGGLGSKLDKSGGEIYGQLKLKYNGMKRILLNDGGDNPYALFGADGSSGDLLIKNERTGKQIILKGNTETYIDAPNLQTTSKEVVGAINEVNNHFLKNDGNYGIGVANGAGIVAGWSNEINICSNQPYIYFGYRKVGNGAAVSEYRFGNSTDSSGTTKGKIVAGNIISNGVNVTQGINEAKSIANGKLDKSGGTISGNLTVTDNIVCNKKISAQSIIINGWELTIEE